MSKSEENFLKAIFKGQNSKDVLVKTSFVAKETNTSQASASDMSVKLYDKGLIYYKKYKGVKLTPDGYKKAIEIVRRHRLWETFLVKKLKFGWEEVHEVAEQLEHIKSPKLINKLNSFLNYPKFDPHGDPIPQENGHVKNYNYITLNQIEQTPSVALVKRIKNSNKEFLDYLKKKSIGLNTIIEIIEYNSYENIIQAKISNSIVYLSEKISSNIYVQKLSND